MNVGMLWFDNDVHVGLEEKVLRAASFYRTKYGRIPTLCYVHPSMLAGAPVDGNGEAGGEPRLMAGAVEIRGNRSLMRNHFWIGIGGAAEEAQTGGVTLGETASPATTVAPAVPQSPSPARRATVSKAPPARNTRPKLPPVSPAAAD